MALDQAILESTSQRCLDTGRAAPTLRFYGWSKPTLSLGYFQSHRRVPKEFEGVEKVRRSTGGGAILHDRELTYSLTVPVSSRSKISRQDLYVEMHAAIVSSLASLGVTARAYRESGSTAGKEDAFLCFQRRTDEDLIISGYKIVGSAQRRARAALLQHGSVLLRASAATPQLPGVFDLTSMKLEIDTICDQIIGSIGGWMNVDFSEGQPGSEELDRARESRQRFESSGWWMRR